MNWPGRATARPGLFVRVKGLEPLRLAARDPKSRLATNYNTPALWTQRYPFYLDYLR